MDSCLTNRPAAKVSYQRQLSQWKIHKDTIGWNTITTACEQRRLAGRETSVNIANKRVSRDRVKKQVRRHITAAKMMNLRRR